MSRFGGSSRGFGSRPPRGDFRGGFSRGSRGFSNSRGRFPDRYDDRRYDDYRDDGYRGGRDREYYQDDYRRGMRGRGRPSRGSPRGGFRDGGGDRRGPGGPREVLAELMTKILFIQSKKYYIDVKENIRGKFVRISEVATNGQKMKLVIDLEDIPEFHEKLSQMVEILAGLGPEKTHRGYEQEVKLGSQAIFRENKKYFLDLKENHRGRFLKMSMTCPNDRVLIVIPGAGVVDVRDILTDVLNEFPLDGEKKHRREKEAHGSHDHVKDEQVIDMGEGKQISVEHGSNARGGFVRINEKVSFKFSTSLLVDEQAAEDFVRLVEEAMTRADDILEERQQRRQQNTEYVDDGNHD